jgi:hypothetical protein
MFRTGEFDGGTKSRSSRRSFQLLQPDDGKKRHCLTLMRRCRALERNKVTFFPLS